MSSTSAFQFELAHSRRGISTLEKFGNCVIRVVYKTKKKDDNSGVFIGILQKPTEPWMPVGQLSSLTAEGSAIVREKTAS